MDRVRDLLEHVSSDYNKWWDVDGKKAFHLIMTVAPDDPYLRAKLMGYIAFTQGQTHGLINLKETKNVSNDVRGIPGT